MASGKISILDCSFAEKTNQALELILRNIRVHAERSDRTIAATFSILICKNVDIDSKSFQHHLLPAMMYQTRQRSGQTFFLITTNSKYVEKHLFQDDVAFLSFHPHHQTQLLTNEVNNYQNHEMLPESGSFLGFFLRRKVIGLETSDLNRY